MLLWVSRYAKPLLWGLLALVVIVGGVLLYVAGLSAGSDDVEHKRAIEQLEQNKKLRKADEKIDREAPDGSDKRRAIEWLLRHTRND